MLIDLGIDAGARKQGKHVPIRYDTNQLINGHALVAGITGTGKSTMIRKMIAGMACGEQGREVRIHVFDVHGDLNIEGASNVLFSEQTPYGMNPLRVNPDHHYGGIRKRVQSFISTFNRVARSPIGGKQEAVLRNILMDIYNRHGFKQDAPATWRIDESKAHLISDGADNRLYLDVPRDQKDQAKAFGARWDPEKFCWFIAPDLYKDGVTRWLPKTAGRTHPTIQDALNYARRLLRMSFLGSDQEAITELEIFNKATSAYQRRALEMARRGETKWEDEGAQDALEKAGLKAVGSYQRYVDSIRTGKELDDLMKYDSTDVLKSVVDRLENLNAIGIFKPAPPPFDPTNPVWCYKIQTLSMEERKLFVLFRLEEIFSQAVQRGEVDGVVECIFLDEAHIFADDDPDNIMNTIAKEARKFGVALICASQSPIHFPDDFLRAVGTKIILGLDEMDWPACMRKMRISDELLKWIKPWKTMAVQMKERGDAKSDWRWTALL